MSKYLTYEERLDIEAGLKQNLSFGEIGRQIGKDRTTIAKEIKKHSCERKSGYSGWPFNACRHRSGCKLKAVCAKDQCRRQATAYCKLCSYCNDLCPDFEEEVCSCRFKPPYVCNGCTQYSKCTLKKTVYDAGDAHIAFYENISEARSGILSSESELSRLNTLISPLIKNGQSVHQVYASHINELMCSEKTIYNYIDACLFGSDGLLQTHIFYCDPSCPHQKGAIEVNHELIRRVLPKGTSFDSLTQDDIVLVMNHVNSYKRKKLNNRSPYQTFSFYYGEDLLHQLGCSPVAAEDIMLKPKLLKK